MAKRNVMFTKPDEPAFLKRMKKDIGYKETMNIDTKNEPLPEGPDDLSDDENEKPQVIVLKPGDLTEEEAEAHQKKIKEEMESTPADLNERIIFNPTKKKIAEKDKKKEEKNRPKSNKKVNQVKLSFEDEEEDNDE